MARRVKKTDNREVDHWVSTDDGRHLPVDKDGNIIFGGSSKKSTPKSKTISSKSKSSNSEKSKSEAPAKELTRKQKVLNDDKVQNLLNTAKDSWGEGVFKDSDGEEFEIGYETDEYYNIYQTSDGQRVDESRVQRMVEGMDSGKYHAWNNQGRLLITSSAKAAVKHAWGTPKEAGLKREAPKESAEKSKSKTTNYGKLPEDIPTTIDRSDLKEIKSLYRKDRSAPSYIQQSPTSGAIMEKYINDATKEGADVKKLRQEFNNFKSDYLAAANLVKSKDAKDYITRKAKEYQKRFDNATRSTTSAPKPTRKTTSSKTNKLKDIFKGEKSSMVEWKINRAYDKTSLKELALDAGVPSSKVRTMSTEELRAMLLSMWKGK